MSDQNQYVNTSSPDWTWNEAKYSIAFWDQNGTDDPVWNGAIELIS